MKIRGGVNRRGWVARSLPWLAAVSAAAALQVWMQHQSRQLGYELAAIGSLSRRLAQERRELEVELATLTSPGVLDRAARERYGLRPPREGQTVPLP